MAYCILSCDGGGIRGLLPAMLVQRIASDLPNFLNQVNLFAGTSAGGLVSLGLASGVSTTDIVNLFASDGAQIFTPFSSSSSSAPPATAEVGESWLEWVEAHLLELADEIAFVKYANTGLYSLLSQLITAQTLSELPRSVLVTTFQLNNRTSGSWAPITISNLGDDPARSTSPIDAGMCTSAAPTYFPPYPHPMFGYCIDGGVYANNPGSMAIASAIQSGVALQDIVMLSIGSGSSAESMQVVPPATNYGPLMWMLPLAYGSTPASPLISVLMDGVQGADAFVCQQILGANYQRLQVTLPTAVPLDDYQDVSLLQTAANSFMSGTAWASAEAWISKAFNAPAQIAAGR